MLANTYGGKLKNSLSLDPQSPPTIKPWINAVTIVLLILLVYLLSQLGTVAEANTKTVTVSINGLTDTYITSSLTVGELLTELDLGNQQITSVTPLEERPLANHSIVTINTLPTARDTVVATNMQATIDQIAAAARKKAEEAKRKAEEAQRQAEAALQPKSPTYYGTASWYDFGSGMTAASTQFPRGTRLRVIAVNSGKTIIVTITDYGPEAWTDIMLDLNRPAFAKLAPLGAGKIYIKYYRI